MVHADSPALEQIAKLIEQPVTGIGEIDATVTGNSRELNAVRHTDRQRHQLRRRQVRGALAQERLHGEGA